MDFFYSLVDAAVTCVHVDVVIMREANTSNGGKREGDEGESHRRGKGYRA